ncbi:DUF938 domain-containing protein [soil metagenome]
MTHAPAPPAQPWTAAEAASVDEKRHAPATLRNRDAITGVLLDVLPQEGLVLEVASGSGEHVLHFARAFPVLTWQPSDPDPAALSSIAAWSREAALPNVCAPVLLDAAAPDWPAARADAVLCINMVHISPWAATVGLFRGGGHVLPVGGALTLYGPFVEDGVDTAESNLAFDQSLKARDAEWGLRNVADVDGVAREFGFARMRRVGMPANNLMLMYRKD